MILIFPDEKCGGSWDSEINYCWMFSKPKREITLLLVSHMSEYALLMYVYRDS